MSEPIIMLDDVPVYADVEAFERLDADAASIFLDVRAYNLGERGHELTALLRRNLHDSLQLCGRVGLFHKTLVSIAKEFEGRPGGSTIKIVAQELADCINDENSPRVSDLLEEMKARHT